MGEPTLDPTSAPADGLQACHAQLAAWRSEDAWRLDPPRFRFLEALADRLAGQPEPVRRLLQDKLHQGLAAYAERLAQARQALAEQARPLAERHPRMARELRAIQAAGDERGLRRLAVRARAQAQTGMSAPLAALAQLSQDLRSAAQARLVAEDDGPVGSQERDPEELSSARRFRRAWSSRRTLERVEQAVSRRPAQAGPLNSHVLVLQSLALMQELSPDYLRRFVAQVESLHWLEQAGARPAAAAAAAPQGRSGRTRAGKADKAGPSDPPARPRRARKA
ncbi:MAG TPA: DUF2894 domain-containing protein [Ramlibacter sp.]|jgi:hypothetical protein|uniref:DUF2894 domain-containing protein n=1 Tax=Ramlibacter sp. TaxID=1917967 RepID=UPI002D42191E|nr:DUF2894 domain-containing protein [Ramlibacter sp.]HZY18806.1 DUF2894 domain-containing protein [Ramlibacter sp.]